MNALTLISDNYSSDESDSNNTDTENGKVTKKLPVPTILTKTVKNHVDDPKDHNGRIRSFEHERGNWASFVYIPFEPHNGLRCLINRICNLVPKNLNLQEMDDFHISLTKTVILKYHWISAFVDNIKDSLKHIKKFSLIFNGVEVYCNEERTRTFISLKVFTGHQELNDIVHILDKCLLEFRLPIYYENPSFHMSILWCVGDYENEFRKRILDFEREFANSTNEYPEDEWSISISQLHCKIGNKLYYFPLIN